MGHPDIKDPQETSHQGISSQVAELLEWVNQKNPDEGAHFDGTRGIKYSFMPSLPLLPAQNKAKPNTLAVTSLFSRLLRLRTRASRCLSAEGGYYTLLEVPARRFAAQLDTSSREALSDAEPVLSADVRLTRGRKRSERRLLLLQEELVIAKLQRGTTLRPQLRLALDQLWVLSGGQEAAGEKKEEEESGDEDILILAWPTGSCVVAFGSRALKELWVGTLLGTPGGAKQARVTRLPSVKPLEKKLSRHHAGRTFSARSLERLIQSQAEDHPKQEPPTAPSGNNADGLCRSPEGGNSSSRRRRRRMGLPWPFAHRRTPAAAQAPGQAGSGCSRALFGQPLAALCGEDGSLPRPIQELLAALHREGPSTEGIFRRAASGTEFRELREALDRGADVDLGSQPALLLAVILKDFLRSIPAKLLVTDLYEDWMAAMQKSGKEEKTEELKAVAEKLPAANLLLLKRLLALLRHISHNASSSRMSASNLAICLGPNLLSPPNEDLLPLQAMLEVTEKVNVLVLFMIERCGDIFGEEMDGRSCPSAGESPAPTDRATDLHLEEQSSPPGRADQDQQAEALV
ncbi:T-cell activation Rho GTPase-activating protein-like, partial [Harpia harpyja]|uniref:T-cell activation Rho GTPase-activating protein-like n=1 Tax=Harpia harpyja TaxID=202280 RepID=UPI0022B10B7D